MIIVSENLKILAERLYKYCNKKLYIVGGAVRDILEGRETKDMDITGAFSESAVKECAFDFKVTAESPKFKTVSISKGREKYEFTSFRTDSYDMSGKHRPQKTVFTDDIKTDAMRRDFTLNAIYYDILEERFEDPVGGAEDFKKRILKTPKSALQTFSEDGLRLMRLVRFKEGLNYIVADDVLKAAKECSYKIREIANERIGQELKYIFNLDNMYSKIPFAHYNAVEFADEIGLLSHILPELTDCKGIEQNKNFHCYDVYRHCLYAFKYAEPQVRAAALFHDIGKPAKIKKYFKCTGHAELSASISDEILKRLNFSVKERKEIKELITYHEFDVKCNAEEERVRVFVLKHIDIIEKLIKLMECDAFAKKEPYKEAVGAKRIKGEYLKMTEKGIPLTVKNLPINGNDLSEAGFVGAEIKKGLNAVLFKGAEEMKKFSRKECLKIISKKSELLSLNYENYL